MDVQAATTAAPPSPIPAATPAASPSVSVGNLPPATTPTAVPSAPTGNPAGPATPGAASAIRAAATGSNAANQPESADQTLKPVVAKLFNAVEANVEVSFQILTDPNEIVTVFTDKSTGKEIIQFPSQTLIALAEMYNKVSGNVLDKNV